MDKLKVVIADDNVKIAKIIEKGMMDTEEFEVLATVTDGFLALEAVETLKPDLLLLDIIMPNLDGISVLEKLNEIRKSGKSVPKVIVLSGVGQDEVTFKAMNLGASYYMIKPFELQAMLNRVRQFLMATDREPTTRAAEGVDVAVHAAKLLNLLTVPQHTKGYHYIKEALLLIDEDLTLLNKITTGLYPEIAKRFDVSTARVERSIRNTIELAVEGGNKALYEKHFGIDYAEGRVKITNGSFLGVLSHLIREGGITLS